MKALAKIMVVFLILVQLSCKDEAQEIEAPRNQEQTAFFLDSRSASGKVKGFNFDNNQVVDYPNTNGIEPDFMVFAQTNDTGYVLGPFLSTPDLKQSFALTKSFTVLDSAKLFYDSYASNADSIFEINALNIKPFQIWTSRYNDGLKGKLLILKSKGDTLENNTPYAELEFFANKLN